MQHMWPTLPARPLTCALFNSHCAWASAESSHWAGALGQDAHPGLLAVVVRGDAVVDGVGVAPRLVATEVCRGMGAGGMG